VLTVVILLPFVP